MSEYLTFKEKVELLKGSTTMQFKEIADRVEDAICEEDFGKNRIACRRNIRAELSKQIQASGLTQNAVATALGISFQNLSHFLHGRIPLPLKTIEEILFLLDGKMKNQ